jgi:outer membrane receptor protein involved in Fe transport
MRLALCATCILLAGSALAQTDRGIITGSVKDASGAAIPEARVTAIQTSTNTTFNTVTTNTGDFTIPSVPPGDYQVRIERDGFKAFSGSGYTITAGGTTSVQAILQVGTVSESIEVTASAATVQTENAKTATQVSNKMVDELPLVVGGAMRSAFDLAMVAPQANVPSGAAEGSDKAFNIGGGQAGAYGAMLDGITILTGRFNSIEWANVNTPSVDAITEFSVETNGFKAEYGRAQGGLITFTSKSGTNEFHGTAYEFLRNDALDSRRFFEAQKGTYKQNDFGWSAGGPVWIPKLYDGRNRTFFFASMEWFRNRVGATSTRDSVPTPEMYQGDFRNWVDANGRQIPIYDPATTRPNPNGSGFIRDAFPNNVIPQNRFSNYAKAVLNNVGNVVFPNTGAAPGTSDYVRNNFINAAGTTLDPWTKWSVKGDHNFGSNDKVSFLYNSGLHEKVPGPDGFAGLPFPLTQTRTGHQKSHVYRGTYTKVLTPTIVNYAFGGVNFWKERNQALQYGQNWSAKGLCLEDAWNCDVNFPIIEFSDFSRWGTEALDGSENFVFSFGDDLTIIRGAHTFKMGYLWERTHYNGFGQQSIAGLMRGDRRSTSVPNDNNLATGGGNGFASFLLGEAFSGGTENERFVGQQWRSHAFYFQDDWKVTPRLTLNLGLRYEFTLPPLEQNDKWSDFTPNKPNPRAGGFPGALRFAGFGEGRENSRTLVDGWWGGWGPRAGLAYALGDKTVIRAAAGRTFGIVKTTTGSTHFDGAVLIFRPTSLDNGVTPAFRLDEGLPPYTRPPVIDPSFANGSTPAYWDNEAVRLPENYQWTFSIQRQLGGSFVAEAAYNATMGAHLVAGLKNINQLPFSVLERYGRNLLSSPINSPAAQAAGITAPYESINCDFSRQCNPISVAQALRPFPQYLDINTWSGHGDKSGHSTYHSMVLKLEKRFAAGWTLNGSYVLSKLLTDADSYDADNRAADHYNRRLEKSIGQYDQTHIMKFSYVYELPFGRGRTWLTSGIANHILGGWRISGFHQYASGFPLTLTNSANYLLFSGRSPAHITSYEGWVAERDNPNWRGADRYFNAPAGFADPANQPNTILGNATRFNPKARYPWLLDESFSLAKSFLFTETLRLDFRWELFNAFNRSRFNPGSTNVQDPNFGIVNSTLNDPRRMQLGLKLYW